MLLCIDVGNTQMVIGLFDGHALADHWRIATVAERTSDELALMMAQFLGFHGFAFDEHITGVAVCSGVPRVTGELREMTERYFGFPGYNRDEWGGRIGVVREEVAFYSVPRLGDIAVEPKRSLVFSHRRNGIQRRPVATNLSCALR